ncbi:MAG: ABC transporter ATP-binding protein [Candidatus Njordarchaeales archaeon]
MSNGVLLSVRNLRKWFPVRRTFWDVLTRKPKLWVRAVDGISFEIKEKEIFGLAGESGSGKTTTGKLLIRLLDPDEGEIIWRGKVDLATLPHKELRPFRKKLQIIYQDPYGALNPRMSVRELLEEPLKFLEPDLSPEERDERIIKALELVKLTPVEEMIDKYPHQLSGGQRQRVVIARAVIANPEFIVADEPVSMLDVSIRAGILHLLLEMREKLGISFLYITHDLATAAYLTDRIAIMYLGKIVEKGKSESVLEDPMHPYSQALISAIPIPDPEEARRKRRMVLKGEIPSPIMIPKGCRFWPRCPKAFDKCRKEVPKLVEVEPGRFVACHLYSG